MKSISTKSSFAFLAFSSLMFLSVALAPPKGAVPEVQPLQPLPEFIKPNVEHNVNGNAEGVSNSNANSNIDQGTNSNVIDNANNLQVSFPIPENSNVISQNTPAPLSDQNQNILLWVVVAGLVIAGVLVALGIRHHFKNQNKDIE